MKKFKQHVEGSAVSQDEWEELLYGPEILEMLQLVDGKWALVSKKTRRPLAYYKGEGKPSDEWVASQERRIQYFKHKGG